jgi:hypothetical protein
MPRLAVSALLAVAAAAAGVRPAGAQFSSSDTACTHTYTVVAGDTCDSIGQKTWTPTYQLMSNNLILSGPQCFSLPIGAVSRAAGVAVLRARCGACVRGSGR